MNFDLIDNSIENDFNTNDLLDNKVIISKQQRNGRKYWTIVEDFKCDDPKKFIKVIKKNGHCNGSHNSDENTFQFQGIQVDLIKNILIDVYEIKEDNIVLRG